MRRIKILSAILIGCTILSTANVEASELIVSNNSNITKNVESDIKFFETSPEIIELMKKRIENGEVASITNTTTFNESRITLSSGMAKVLSDAGFDHSAYLLDYSMWPLRKEPKEIYADSVMASHIWTYSPDFENVVRAFLNEAKSKGSYQYFKTTSMIFQMPTEGKLEILGNEKLKIRTDLFGALKKVKINLGVVKNKGAWTIDVIIEDTYDFSNEKYTGFVDLVNNIAYYEQELGKIKPYDIYIYAGRANMLRLPFGVSSW